MKTMSLWMFGLLLISFTRAHELNYFPENFEVVKSDGNITLLCGAKTGENVRWELNGEAVEDDRNSEDSNLFVSDVDEPSLGEYSCWKGGQILSSTYLLLKDDEEEEEDKFDLFFKCRAKSYNCTFSCTWNHSGDTAVRLGLGHDCRQGLKSCHWFNSSKQLPHGGFQFELPHSLSPYAEESNRLELTAEAINGYSILRRTKSFFLRDIVQPDSPQIVGCQEMDQDLNVTINPPSSWSVPHSFFTLENQIEYELRDNGMTGLSSTALIPRGSSKLRVRCRDPLVYNSTWSQWTRWNNVRAGKKLHCRKKGGKKGGKKDRRKKQETKN